MHFGNVFVVSAPSGTGKSSLVRELCKLDNCTKLSISHTTRAKRFGETDGVDYHFVDQAKFKDMLDSCEFIEYALVYGNYYGTSRSSVECFTKNGMDIILEIDHQGALQIKKIIPNAILIYIMPPSISELESRLRSRNTDSEEVIKARLAQADDDISYSRYFDYIVINDDFHSALSQLHDIIITNRK